MQNHLLANGHKGVAPIIATLLMVAIAVVGGILIFVFAQGFFNQTQVSSAPQIENVQIIGYNATTAVTALADAYGNVVASSSDGGVSATKLATGDNVFLFVKNSGSHTTIISTVQFAGATYTLDTASAVNTSPTTSIPVSGKFCLMDATSKCITGSTKTSAILQPGGIYTIVLNLPNSLKAGLDIGAIISTTLGNQYQGTIVIGQAQA